MWRYYAIAAAIVLTVGSALFGRHLALGGWHLHSDVRGAPSPAHGNGNEGFVTTPAPFFTGEGGWVLSALPGCFTQLSSIAGPARALTFHVPPANRRIRPGTSLRAGPCTVLVRAHDIWVYRGRDRLRVPPEAALYDTKAGLTLVYAQAGRADVRVYAPAR